MKVTAKILADAIRKNGVIHIRHALFEKDYKGNIIGACALGQAMRNLGISDTAEGFQQFNVFKFIECPVKNSEYDDEGEQFNAVGIIVHLNDTHKWPLDMIADFVEQNLVVNPQ